MAFLYKRENRSTTILMACPSSHLLLQMFGMSAVFAGERQNLGVESWQVSKRENVFSIPCFKIHMLQIWGADLVRRGNDADWFSLGICPLKPTLCPPWQDPQCWQLSGTRGRCAVTSSRVTLAARWFSKITALYLLIEIYHIHPRFQRCRWK